MFLLLARGRCFFSPHREKKSLAGDRSAGEEIARRRRIGIGRATPDFRFSLFFSLFFFSLFFFLPRLISLKIGRRRSKSTITTR
ncbi:hypothetical protein BHE74_00024242 [Ensete ventricosum]|nr:hypothetical protein BHE74_00024242 [Ensete ventricosum]